MTHGPDAPGVPSLVTNSGCLGLPMFFVLSAYLITELLMRERDKTGTISWGRFFTRRALRIWPLYYGSLALSAVFTLVLLRHHWVDRKAALVFGIFIANWVPHQVPLYLGPLWSISIEEQFYLIWPPISKIGGRKLAWAVSVFFVLAAALWLWRYYPKGWVRMWFDAPVQFLFFAVGAMIALWTRGGRTPVRKPLSRAACLFAGVWLFLLVGLVCIVQPNPHIALWRFYVGYGAAAFGCALIFIGALGVSRIPKPLAYLGKISFGLYVFHIAMLKLAVWLTRSLGLHGSSIPRIVVVDCVALLLCIAAAHLSYQYFETPFLKLKRRFEIVESRPV
jgi:peptidoglycan/LPS O-acetylase OafA/YrhL